MRTLGNGEPFVECVHRQVGYCCLFFARDLLRCYSRLLLVAQRAPITIGTTLALMFHILCISNLRSWYFSIFSLSFSAMCVSFGIDASTMSPSFLLLVFYYYVSSVRTDLNVPQWLCCSLLLGWACEARCYLSLWSRSADICCGG